jgi:replicative DNA helicase
MMQARDYIARRGFRKMSIADMKVLSWLMKGPAEYNKVLRDIDGKLLHEAFLPDYKPLNKIITDYYSRYKTPPSYKILSDNLTDDIDTLQLIILLEREDCDDSEILFYVDKMKNRYNEYLARRLAKSLSESEVDVEEFNKDIVSIASKIERMKKSAVFAEGDFRKSADDRYNDYIFTSENPNAIKGVFTGYSELDDYTFGIRNSEMMVISGASSSGKSLLMMNMAINAWMGDNIAYDLNVPLKSNGKNVLYFTLEMSKQQLEQRIDANVSVIRHKALSRGHLTDEERDRWKVSLEFQKDYDKSFYVVDLPRGSRTLDIEARYDSIIAEFQPDLVCVDYLGIMKPNRDFGQDWLEVGHTAADLHEFCRSKNIPVITAAQRKARNKSGKSQYNDLEELGRSKMIGDNANIVLLIEQREDEFLKDDMILHVVKNRDGAKGEVKLKKDFPMSRVISFPDGWADDLGEENST